MASKTKGQAVALAEPVEPVNRSLIQGFIEISPNFFMKIVGDKFHQIDYLRLRYDGLTYQDGIEDKYGRREEDKEMYASVYYNKASLEKFIYIPRKGRLYCSDCTLEIAQIITVLRAHEALKVIK